MGFGWLLYYLVLVLCFGSLKVDSVGSYLQRLDGTRTVEILGQDIFFEILEPKDLSYTYRTRPARNFGTPFNSSHFGNDMHLVPVDPPSGCSRLFNSVELAGNIALIERGQCSFVSKAVRAEESGARAVIIADNTEGDEYYIEMIDDMTEREVNIPATFLLGKNGFIIRKTLQDLHMEYAVINIPVNMSYVSQQHMNQPPWLSW